MSYSGLFWYKILYAITYAVIPVFRNWANLFPFKLHINWNHHMSLSLVSQIMQINWGISPICSYSKNIYVMSDAITEYGSYIYVGSLWNFISFRFLSNRTRETSYWHYGRKSPVIVSRRADVLHSSLLVFTLWEATLYHWCLTPRQPDV